MKKKIILIIGIACILLTGCFKRDQMEDINIITTIYPIEYVVNVLYGNSANISSIYARGIDIKEAEFTDKQLNDFSSYDLFIYNGESGEREYATYMLNKNKNLKIIDAAYGLEAVNTAYDVWLNPANILMIAQNIKQELENYISNPYLKEEINTKYNSLKVDISELEAEFKRTSDNSANPKIICNDESLLFLEKYGFEVINITEHGEIKSNNLELAKSLISNNELNYVFVHEFEQNEDGINDLVNNYGAQKLTFKVLATITEEDLNTNEDYLSIMHQNINAIKTETYK